MLAVDDHVAFLALLGQVLRASDELELLAEADSGERAIELVEELQPDVVLMDVRLPGMDGIQAAKLIKTNHPSTLVLLNSTTPPEELPPQAGDVRADAIVWKSELDPKRLDEIWLRYRNQSLRTVG
ncbi:MAG TPA: response regulator transcription factor [Solirubrobacteraceae bacterium]|nr:response regulator transcription factor [Solirubrobacteraceae bacterium]